MSKPEIAAAQHRKPLQQRSLDRVEAVLDESRKVLAREGIAGFSIPVIAERLGYTRASIYNFFPTPYAILNELARRDLVALEESIVQYLLGQPRAPWRERVRGSVRAAVQFYDKHPVARMLILGGALTDEGYRALALTVRHLGAAAQRLFSGVGPYALPQVPVDVSTLAVDLGTTCLRQSVLLHGKIVRAYEEEAVRVMTGYLESYFEPGER
jgi:AcrR family transcriptional regulator